jgi:hypothetical protein
MQDDLVQRALAYSFTCSLKFYIVAWVSNSSDSYAIVQTVYPLYYYYVRIRAHVTRSLARSAAYLLRILTDPWWSAPAYLALVRSLEVGTADSYLFSHDSRPLWQSHHHLVLLLYFSFPVVIHTYHWITTGMLPCSSHAPYYLSLNHNEILHRMSYSFTEYRTHAPSTVLMYQVPYSFTKYRSRTTWYRELRYIYIYRRTFRALLLSSHYFTCNDQWLQWLFDIEFIHPKLQH